MSLPVPKSGILDIKPYIGGEGRVAGVTRLIRLASNENPLGCSPKAREAYLKMAAELHRYPDGAAADLRAALAQEYKMEAERIVCGAGSDELISLIVRAYAGAGDELVYSEHGFLMYPINAKAVGAKPVAAKEIDLRADIHALLAAVTPKTKIMLLANPNNPTGSYLARAELRVLREKLPENILLVIDAAYAEFVGAEDYEDGRALVDAYPNVVTLRTFSKIHGLAGLRVGWGYFPVEVAGVINRVRGAFNVSLPAQAAAVAALGDREFVQKSIALAKEGRAFLAKELQGLGLKVYPSVANFLLVEFGASAEDIRIALKDKGIFVRQMGAYNLPQCLRITIGTAEDNAAVVGELKRISGLR
ncbi:MAG: histidinol-phosphate transaminase [Alphaproteobacteria bacterium]|nr:histidinol-phosphate transaminase [Alphaproteobacteria bacterium]